MKIRWLVTFFLILCICGGLIAGLFSHSIEAALTAPLSIKTITSSPVATAKPSMPPSPTTTVGIILAQDTFQRPNQVFWGTASDGRQWTGDANSIEVFSVAGRAGQVDHAQGTFNAILGPVNANLEVIFSGVVNQFTQNSSVNMGAVLHWSDANNWYKALIDGSKLQILKRVNGKTTSLGSASFSARGGTSYTLRFRAVGAALSVKAWQTNQPEPSNWMLTEMDTALSTGFGGLRFLLQNDTLIRVTSFHETAINNLV